MSDEQKMQVVTIGFAVPADLDLPSEVRGRMKMLLIEGLLYVRGTGQINVYSAEDRALIDALLTES